MVLGASDNPSRYSFLAIKKLRAYQHPVVAVGKKNTKVDDVSISKDHVPETGVDTITLYLNPKNQVEYYDYILNLNPKRIIFNPGTENDELIKPRELRCRSQRQHAKNEFPSSEHSDTPYL